jgi:hypothetical protein
MPPLTVARVGIGVAAILKAIELWPLLDRLASDPHIVQMPLAPWPRPSAATMPWIVAAWAGMGAAVAAGVRVSTTGAILAALIGYVVTLDQQTYSNHLYLLAVISALLALAHRQPHRATAAALVRWQLVIVYAFAAASKVNAEFLSGRVIASNLSPDVGGLATSPAPTALAVTAVVAEGFVACGLMRPRWRAAAAIVGVGLHLSFIVMIRQTVAMIAFAMICLSLYPLYWSDESEADRVGERHAPRAR